VYIPEDKSELHTRRRENLKSHIVNLYGEATLRCIRRFESLIALMMEAARTSETSVDNYFTRQYIPEDKSEKVICMYITLIPLPVSSVYSHPQDGYVQI
jgi:hypothetical protein